MTGLLVVSVVLQWLVIGLLVAVVLGLLRNQGALARRLDGDADPSGTRPPLLGEDVGTWTVPTVTGAPVRLGGDRERPQLVVLWSADCARCADVPRILAAFVASRPEAEVLAVLAASTGVARRVAGQLPAGQPVARLADFPDELLPPVDYPYAFALTADGVLAAVGTPRTPDDLTGMVAAATHADLDQPGAWRAHDWGRSVPHWEPRPAHRLEEQRA